MDPKRAPLAALFTCAILGAAISGCIAPVQAPQAQAASTVRDIRVWVEPLDWELHPGVTTPVWAFCAEGDGVEPVHQGPCGVPGPTIRVTAGDTIRLTFDNTHSMPHTVHFHGRHPFSVDMNGNGLLGEGQVVDGGEAQTIEWVAEPAGSFIYHCHFKTPTHMDMGMYGVFIVEDPAETDKPDLEYVAVLDEWAVHDDTTFTGSMPTYNYFTINGLSFPLTQPWIANTDDHVRIHMVNAGYEFHAFHMHGYTPLTWEGVSGPAAARLTDVREIAPGQTVVLDFIADREGVWLSHDHVVPRVTAGANGQGFGAYPRGMLNLLVVGTDALKQVKELAPTLIAAAREDPRPTGDHSSPQSDHEPPEGTITIAMKDVVYKDAEIRVPTGTAVQWVNRDPMGHTVTANDGAYDSGNIPAGATWTRTFNEPGTYAYHCAPHSYKDKTTGEWKGMVGVVIVEDTP